MTDEAAANDPARPDRPDTSGTAGGSAGAPGQTDPGAEPTGPGSGQTGAAGADAPPPGDPRDDPTAGPGGGPGSTGTSPGTAFTSRYGLIRPAQGRYLAGVCAAIGRATNTDPILWRVLLAVLGFFGGIGILVYVAAWLIIPAEGDTASPVEALLGRGRSSMSPVTVLILGILVAVMFGFIVTDGFRAVLLGTAILIGGALLINRDPRRAAEAGSHGAPSATPGPTAPMPPAAGWPSGYPPLTAPIGGPASAPAPAPPYSAAPPPPATTAPAAHPSAPLPQPPMPAGLTGYPPAGPPAAGAPWGPPAGYRAPFAPHGPYAIGNQQTPHPTPPPWRKPAKPPRERSRLGAVTFSMIFVALGAVAILDLTNAVQIWPSTYFAAVLVTIALGLLVGTWFGRARWLIALGLVAACALGVSSLAESYSQIREDGTVTWAPADHTALADRYETRFGDATLDLTQLDFTGQDRQVTAEVSVGRLVVMLPREVDVTVLVKTHAGEAEVLGKFFSGVPEMTRTVTDLGPDGTGGGTLRLYLRVDAGKAEVLR